MKYFKILIIPVLLVITLLISCERDDICAASTPTTPNLIIDLIDSSNSENSKTVFDLVVVGEEKEDILDGYNIVDVNQIILPLRTDVNTTQYSLFKGYSIDNNDTPDDTSDDIISEGNEDVIVMNYTREQVYVSRACGFKTIFKNVTLTIVADDDNWMISRQSVEDNQSVEDEITHFYVSI